MTGTRRTPIARSRTSPITPVAVKLFDQMRQCRCTCPPRDWHDPKTWIRVKAASDGGSYTATCTLSFTAAPGNGRASSIPARVRRTRAVPRPTRGGSPTSKRKSCGGSWRRRARPPARHDSVRRPPSSSLHLRHDADSIDRFPAAGGFAGRAHGAVRFKAAFLEQLAVELRNKALGDVRRVAYEVARAITR